MPDHKGLASLLWLALLDLIRNPNKYIISLNEFNYELAEMILNKHNLAYPPTPEPPIQRNRRKRTTYLNYYEPQIAKL